MTDPVSPYLFNRPRCIERFRDDYEASRLRALDDAETKQDQLALIRAALDKAIGHTESAVGGRDFGYERESNLLAALAGILGTASDLLGDLEGIAGREADDSAPSAEAGANRHRAWSNGR